MTEIKQTITIDAPVEKVLGYVSNYQNCGKFFKGITEVQPITDQTLETAG
jgi:hypothetical protein